jgi:hypothetical protein
MSFILQHRPLFSVSVQDSASSDTLPAFSFAPGSRTRRLLDDHQLVFRPLDTGFAVYYRLNPQAANPLMGPIRSRVRLSFLVRLTESGFFERYEPSLTPDTGPQFYLDNLTSGGAIQPATTPELSAGSVVQKDDAMKLVPQIFTATADVSGAAPPSKFVVRDKFNPATVVLQVPITAGGSDAAQSKIDLSDEPAGPYLLETDAAGASRKTIYADDGVVGSQAIGLVDLYWETAQDTVPMGGVEYIARFRKR